jgi:hypothetical protein
VKFERWAFLTDLHVPFHHDKAVDFALAICREIDLHGFLLGGDLLDFYNLNHHAPLNPKIEDLRYEIDAGRGILKRINRDFPRCRRVFLIGNHEARLEKWILKNCPALYNFVNLPDMLNLNEDGWTVVPYGPMQAFHIGAGLYARHEPIAGGLHAAKNTAAKGKIDLIFGHTHRLQVETDCNLVGRTFKTMSPGWLGDFDRYPEIFGYVKGPQPWTLGFAIIYIDRENGQFYEHIIHIKESNGKLYANFNGKVYAR